MTQIMDMLAPEAQALVAMINAADLPSVADGTPASARALTAAMTPPADAGPPVSRTFHVEMERSGQSPLQGIVIWPHDQPRRLIVYFHGGGWVIGAPSEYEAFGRFLAVASGSAILLAGYSLSPENPFPAPVDDALAWTRWAMAQRTALAGSDVPVIIGGDSAGGNLAAVVAQRLRDLQTPGITAQLLIYPVTDYDPTRESYSLFADAPILARRDMEWFWDQYLADASRRTEPMAAPIRASSLADLPQAVMVTAEVDLLRSEAEDYAAALLAAGVPVKLKRYDGMPHGFFPLPHILAASRDAIAFIAAELDKLE